MVSRNRDSISFFVGLTSSIIGIISLLFCCVGVSLTSWYRGTNANNTVIIAEANLFSACFASNVSQGIISIKLICTSYNSFICTTTSYQNNVLNVTSYISGCTNPTNGSSMYLTFNGPIYQILLDDFYRLRSAAALSILSILFIFSSIIFSLVTTFILLNIYLVFLSPILSFIGVIFGTCCLVTSGSVFNYTGTGFALFVVGTLLELIVTTLLSIIAGRLNRMGQNIGSKEDEPIYANSVQSPIIIRRIQKQKI
jgi:hypothetical protein